MNSPERICVVGLWHLGSVLAACWAELGHSVIGLDASRHIVDEFRAGHAPIFEPGLDEMLQKNAHEGRLTFTTDFHEAIPSADIVFLACDTPVDGDDRSDLAPLEHSLCSLSPLLKGRALVVVSSQVPVGTCTRWRTDVRRTASGRDVDLVYSPENLRLGEAIHCYLHPDRIVVGAEDKHVEERVGILFAPMAAPILTMDLASAEMAKHALNGYLATSVSFINEIATLCEIAGADVLSVVEALRYDPRIGRRAFLSPGIGFAGGTLARDLQILKDIGAHGRYTTPLLDGVLEVNRRRPGFVLRRLMERFGSVEGLVVGVLGLTYKAGTSTLRRSVSLEVIRLLVSSGAVVQAFDPKADLRELSGPPEFATVCDAYEAARGASALVILTEWPEFTTLDYERVKSLMASPVILDGKNLLTSLGLDERGFTYMGVGR